MNDINSLKERKLQSANLSRYRSTVTVLKGDPQGYLQDPENNYRENRGSQGTVPRLLRTFGRVPKEYMQGETHSGKQH